MRIAQEEIFGPVLCVIKYDSLEHAIRMANDTIYGLAAGVWSSDVERAISVANRLRAGTVWINDYPPDQRGSALRRLQTERDRPRAGRVGPEGVPGGQAHPRRPDAAALGQVLVRHRRSAGMNNRNDARVRAWLIWACIVIGLEHLARSSWNPILGLTA